MTRAKTYKIALDKETLKLRKELLEFRHVDGACTRSVDMKFIDKRIESQLKQVIRDVTKHVHSLVVKGEINEMRIPLDLTK